MWAIINNMTKQEVTAQQEELCAKYKTPFYPPMLDIKLGISKKIMSGTMPINALRHHPENGTSGWYIWEGEYSENINDFEPMHGVHLFEKYPELLKYLALPPGYRFQIDNKGYEDVWFDSELLKTKKFEIYCNEELIGESYLEYSDVYNGMYFGKLIPTENYYHFQNGFRDAYISQDWNGFNFEIISTKTKNKIKFNFIGIQDNPEFPDEIQIEVNVKSNEEVQNA